MRRAIAWTGAALVALLLVPGPLLAGEDSPWPEEGTPAEHKRAIAKVLRELEDEVDLMELSAARYARWEKCLRGIPVSELGDHDRRYGFAYDERDGTGRGHMPALAVDRRSRAGREDYLMLDFSPECESAAPRPGGTAEPASAAASALRGYERRVRRLDRAVGRLDAASERFDAWESCISWVPVTEYGDPDGQFGYIGDPPGYRTGIAVDRSDWDDPDYMMLAFVGGDRPGGTCQDEPGEAVD
jgi:hypothetical protein